MNKMIFKGIPVILFLAVMFASAMSIAVTEQEIIQHTHIINLEASPQWFKEGTPIDFIVTIKYDGKPRDGFDVGVYHEQRLVGWENNKRLNQGMNTFKLHDANFKGDKGKFFVKVRHKGEHFAEKVFETWSRCELTIDPKADHKGKHPQ